ncbi:MAG: hypothetical protein IPJ71_01870 [Bdellovibrionales bacterium]|nr:hypothetical protein [Bdellovibrionales bacterium]
MAKKLDLSRVQNMFYLHGGLKAEVFFGSLEEGPKLNYRRSLRVISAQQSLILEGIYCRISDGQVEVKSKTEFRAGKIVSHSVEYFGSGQRVELKSFFTGWFQRLSSYQPSGCKVQRFFGRDHVSLAYFSWLSPELSMLLDMKKSLECNLIRMEQVRAYPIKVVREESLSSSQVSCLRMYSRRNDLEFPETLLTFDRQTGRLLQTKGYMYPPPHVGRMVLSYPHLGEVQNTAH